MLRTRMAVFAVIAFVLCGCKPDQDPLADTDRTGSIAVAAARDAGAQADRHWDSVVAAKGNRDILDKIMGNILTGNGLWDVEETIYLSDPKLVVLAVEHTAKQELPRGLEQPFNDLLPVYREVERLNRAETATVRDELTEKYGLKFDENIAAGKPVLSFGPPCKSWGIIELHQWRYGVVQHIYGRKSTFVPMRRELSKFRVRVNVELRAVSGC